jgi:hypothetical protein
MSPQSHAEWWAAAWRDVHINDAEPSVGLPTCHFNGVGIADWTGNMYSTSYGLYVIL